MDIAAQQFAAPKFGAARSVGGDEIERVRNIDVAPTILALLDVAPAATVQGRAIDLCRRGHGHRDRDDD